MTSSLISSYPTGEHLEGNFVQNYTTNYTYFDRNVARKYGERGIEVDEDTTIAEASADWLQDVNSIVFAHLTDWAKMYSALIKDYEPLWNVDGTTVYTYGETKDTNTFGATQLTDQFGATQNTDQYGQKQRTDLMGARSESDTYGATQDTDQYGNTSETLGQRTDTSTKYARSYNSGTDVTPEHDSNVTGQQTNTTNAHTDTHSSLSHTDGHTATSYTDTHTDAQSTDTHSSIQHSDIHSTTQHIDTKEGDEHVDTERRTGNIGVTETTQLIRNSVLLHSQFNFYDIIFKFIMKEMGCIYYDWH